MVPDGGAEVYLGGGAEAEGLESGASGSGKARCGMGDGTKPISWALAGGSFRLRWVGSALLFAESRWNRIHGYRHTPMLINALNAAYQLRCAHNQAALKSQVSAA